MKEMTGRERLLTALNMEEPDRVPISPRVFTATASKVLGVKICEMESPLATCPIWKAQIEVFRKLKMDAWLEIYSGSVQLDTFCSAPEVRTKLKVTKREDEKVWLETTFETPRGPVTKRIYCPSFDDHPWVHGTDTKCLITNLRMDLEKIKYLFPSSFNASNPLLSEYDKAKILLDEDGIVSLWVHSPIENWVDNRGLYLSIRDLYRERDVVMEYFHVFEQHALELTRVFCEHQIDVLVYSGYPDGLIYFDPTIFKKYSFQYLREVAKIAREYDVPLAYYISGPINPILDLIKQSNITCVFPLETPETRGDVILREIKEKIGNEICLRGNFYLPEGTTAEAEMMTRECINAAASGGGYIFATTDTTDDVTMENVIAFIKEAKKYGKYPLKC